MKILFGVPGRLVASLIIAAAVASLAVVGTLAYFSGTSDQNVTLTTATISIGNPTGFPLTFNNMLPGETQTQNVTLQNTGNRTADIYVQLEPNGGTSPDLCNPTDTGSVLTLSTGWTGDVCKLYPGWAGSVIAPVAAGVGAGATISVNVSMALPGNLGNAYQNGSHPSVARLIAVQAGGPAPAPELGPPAAAWPAGDSNYP